MKICQTKRKPDETEESSLPTLAPEADTLSPPQYASHDPIDPQLKQQLAELPSRYDLRRRSYIILIILILSTCFTIYLTSFLSLGIWLSTYYDSSDLSPANTTVNPFYASLVITLTGFNQNGLSVW